MLEGARLTLIYCNFLLQDIIKPADMGVKQLERMTIIIKKIHTVHLCNNIANVFIFYLPSHSNHLAHDPS